MGNIKIPQRRLLLQYLWSEWKQNVSESFCWCLLTLLTRFPILHPREPGRIWIDFNSTPKFCVIICTEHLTPFEVWASLGKWNLAEIKSGFIFHAWTSKVPVLVNEAVACPWGLCASGVSEQGQISCWEWCSLPMCCPLFFTAPSLNNSVFYSDRNISSCFYFLGILWEWVLAHSGVC